MPDSPLRLSSLKAVRDDPVLYEVARCFEQNADAFGHSALQGMLEMQMRLLLRIAAGQKPDPIRLKLIELIINRPEGPYDISDDLKARAYDAIRDLLYPKGGRLMAEYPEADPNNFSRDTRGVERAARALAREYCDDQAYIDHSWISYLPQVRLVLETLRQPTIAQIIKGGSLKDSVQVAWPLLVDALLEENP